MIDKLLTIKNIGIFNDLQVDSSSWDKGFKRNNLIFAANGQGKTTLSVIFESLAKGNGELLIGRKTLGSAGTQKIEFLSGTKKIKFENDAWTELIPDIEIFNARFITENLYIGDTINPEHKRNLHQFVLGEEGVNLINQINGLDEQIKQVQGEIKAAEKIIQSHTAKKMATETFITLPNIDNINEQIRQLESTLKNLEQSEDIIKHSEFTGIEIKLPDINEIKNLLTKGYNDISKEAERLVNEHIKNLNSMAAGNWINQGLTLIQKDKCPFCGCDVSESVLIQAYKQYFSQKYEEYKKGLSSQIDKIGQELSEANIFRLRKAITDNIREAQYWSEKTGDTVSVSFNEEVISVLESLTEILKSLFIAKKNDILSTISLPDEVTSILDQVTAQVAACQQNVKENNQKVKEFKQKISSANKNELQGNLDKLYLTQKRYMPEIDTACQEYTSNNQTKQGLEGQKVIAKGKLDQYTEIFRSSFAVEINTILEKFGAGFILCDIDTDYRSGPKFEFKLSINGQPFCLCDTKNRDSVPQFKNTLSEGDKTTLAFAFFVAKLNKSSDIDKKIVVIDDPISSLDFYRVNMTASILSELLGKVMQIFVLTHDLKFAKKYFDRTHKTHGIIMLEIKNRKFSKFDIDKSQLSDYFINYFILDDYICGLSTESEISVVRAIRPLLEAHYRMHYPKHFNCEKWLGNFIDMVRTSTSEHPYFGLKDKLPEIEAVNDYSKQYHHDTNPLANNLEISATELKSFAIAALSLCS